MKKALLITMITLSLMACSLANGEAPAEYLERASTALTDARGDKRQLEDVLMVYKEGLEQHPNNSELLSSRAQLLTSLGRYEEAKLDLDELHTGELNKEEMLLRCMLIERLDGVTDEARACYGEVESAYAREANNQPDANYILAAHLAESPQSDSLLLEWQTSNDPMKDSVLDGMLELERDVLIQQFLP
ncbi:tetratricopeptide repeat protein [Halomonas sp. SpR8]|uniref:tetratricopeptide repeat protein n=1 Tax=Halomonas sp. SpR8 TaxID=3050463 RepID=UPI0027E52AB7|nr:tetratricopeptide repeat protein [Halomonas sp. SpR8]MDQ7729289.1 tetratricopeptide repeat protein [Halomonas sp. SpR8]